MRNDHTHMARPQQLIGRSYNLQIPHTARQATGKVGPRIGAEMEKYPSRASGAAGNGHNGTRTSATTTGGSATGF